MHNSCISYFLFFFKISLYTFIYSFCWWNFIIVYIAIWKECYIIHISLFTTSPFLRIFNRKESSHYQIEPLHPGPSGCHSIYEYNSGQRKGLNRSSYPYSSSDNSAFYRDQNTSYKLDSSQNPSLLRQLVAVKHPH